MYCSECGLKLPESAKFCPRCGTAAAERDDALRSATVPVRATMTTPPAASLSGSFATSQPPSPARSNPVPAQPDATQRSGRFSGAAILGILGGGIILFFIIAYLYTGVTGPEREATFRQWMTAAGSFYQNYFRIENEFETVNQNPQTTHPQAVQAWTRLMQGLQGMQGQLTALQPPAGAARDDAADMTRIHQLWSDLLAVEIQMGQQLLQYSRQGQRPPAEFLQGTLPRLWQTKNKQLQDQQLFLVRLAVRHRVSAVNANTPNQQQAAQ